MSTTQWDAVFDRDAREYNCIAWIGDPDDDENYWEAAVRGYYFDGEWEIARVLDGLGGSSFGQAWIDKWNDQLISALNRERYR